MSKDIKGMLGSVFNDIADAIETGSFGDKARVAITTLGSELGIENVVKGAELAAERDNSIEVVLIGPKVDSKLTQVVVEDEDEGYKKMEEMLDSGEIGACVTMHYNFPIGVSTVGRVSTPALGKEMYIATTTGTSSAHRVEGMVKNAIYGIITAKSMGIEDPSIGILNVDGARQVERALKTLSEKYPINFADSARSDGGVVMRGNDLLMGTPDVMVTDSLTGNILMKMFSSYTTGGGFEASGYGYGPGIGEGYDRNVLIISRASGSPVIANAISYGASLAKGNVSEVSKTEFEKANKAGFQDILAGLTKEKKPAESSDEEVVAPAKEVVGESIEGIDILELDDAAKVLWKVGIYAETGMGCTGPVVMVNAANLNKAIGELAKAGYVDADEGNIC